MNRGLIIILIFAGCIFSCKREIQTAPPDHSTDHNKKKEALIHLNRYLVERNADLIQRFAERTGWKMKKTGTGLWYDIYETGKGPQINENENVAVAYTITLLDGTWSDTIDARHPATFRTGMGGVEPGLEEGLLLLHEGDKARFIIPPHLGHGNFGDREHIPPGAILLVNVSMIKLIK
jgi:FKBP-type peptidyl-prolyl cis-trans isomerase FkpA